MSNTISAQGWALSGNPTICTSYNVALIGTVPKISGKVEKVELKIPFSAGHETNNYGDNMYPFFFKDASQLTYDSVGKYYENEAYNGILYDISQRALQLLTPATNERELSSGGTRAGGYINNTLTFTRNELTELGKDASNWVGEVYFAIERDNIPGASTVYRPYYMSRKSTLTIYYSPNNIKYGVNGEWVDCVPYYGVNGEWRQVEVSLGLNNEWVR